MSEQPHHQLFRSQVDFSSRQNHQGSPKTEFLQPADHEMEFKFFNQKMTFSDGAEFEMWTFESATSGRAFPAPLVRITEGQIFHGTIKPSKKVHTLHWHGIEPDPRNDGVGHTSFEVSGSYTYQWKPEKGRPGIISDGTAGTYFYHCHVNTPLHVQMGMFGPLVVDPVVHPDFPASPGARRTFVDGPEYDIETETLLVAFEVDPKWHNMNHAAGLSGEDAGLDRFEPSHFYLMGGELDKGPPGPGPWEITALRAVAPGGSRKPTLMRLLNGSYFPVDMKFTDAAGKPVAMAELLSHDGRPFRDTNDPDGPAPPTSDKDPLMTDFMSFGAAERFDVLLRPPGPGKFTLTVELRDWITRAVMATRIVTITASRRPEALS
jgi:FtsP/CotA-like multicopper oxidase with cupredoxin domain